MPLRKREEVQTLLRQERIALVKIRLGVVACGRSVLTYYEYAPCLPRLAPGPNEFFLRAKGTCEESVATNDAA